MINTSPDTGKHSGVTDLVGRRPELTAIAGLLDRARFVTVTGPGGVGKTRLAMRLAGELWDDFDGEIYVTELAAVSEPSSTVAAIATALDVQQRQPRGRDDCRPRACHVEESGRDAQAGARLLQAPRNLTELVTVELAA